MNAPKVSWLLHNHLRMPDRKKPPAGYAKGISKVAAAARLRAARQERARLAARIRARVPPAIQSPVNYMLTTEQIAVIVALALAMQRKKR